MHLCNSILHREYIEVFINITLKDNFPKTFRFHYKKDTCIVMSYELWFSKPMFKAVFFFLLSELVYCPRNVYIKLDYTYLRVPLPTIETVIMHTYYCLFFSTPSVWWMNGKSFPCRDWHRSGRQVQHLIGYSKHYHYW